jgi:hypothetical protein
MFSSQNGKFCWRKACLTVVWLHTQKLQRTNANIFSIFNLQFSGKPENFSRPQWWNEPLLQINRRIRGKNWLRFLDPWCYSWAVSPGMSQMSFAEKKTFFLCYLLLAILGFFKSFERKCDKNKSKQKTLSNIARLRHEEVRGCVIFGAPIHHTFSATEIPNIVKI